MIPADLLDDLKAWLGIPPDDLTQDAFLTAESEVVLSAMRSATGRWLYPPAVFDDAFAVPVDPCNPCHPSCGCACPAVSVSQLPASNLMAVKQDGAALALANYILQADGKLRDVATLRPVPVPGSGWLSVNYVGGFQELPAELKHALFNLVGAAWNGSGRGSVAGVAPTGVAKMTIIDVGSIEYADAGGGGVSGDGAPDPILGRYAPLMAPYIDQAAQIGGHPCRESVKAADPVPLPPDADALYVNVSGDTMTGALGLPVGLGTAPSLTFGDVATGLWGNSTSLGLVLNGAGRVTINTNEIFFAVPIKPLFGTASAPGYSFNGDSDVGMWRPAADTMAFSTAGVERLRIANTVATSTVPLALPAGSSLSPILMMGDTDSGLYGGADVVGVAINAQSKLVATATDVSLTVNLRVAGGSAATPGIAFSADSDVGVFRAAPDAIGFATAGVERLRIANAALTSAVPILLPADPTLPLQAATKQYADITLGLTTSLIDALAARVAALEARLGP